LHPAGFRANFPARKPDKEDRVDQE